MEMQWVIDFINQIGFPIAVCVYLAFENREQRKSNNEQTDKLSKVIEGNTLSLTKLTDKMEEMLHEDLD